MPLKISRILHAGYLLECENARIAFDPIFENPFSLNCFSFPEVEFSPEKIKKLKLDAVFISHYHDDHCSFESLKLLDRDIPIYMFCQFEEIFTLLRELGFKNVFSLQLNNTISIGDFEILPRKALDEDVDSLFHIKYKNLNILNVVDSWIDYETLDLLAQTEWNLILWPFQTMRELEVLSPLRATKAPRELPPEWKEQIKILNPQFIVPSSCQFKFEEWSWYNKFYFPISYESFSNQVSLLLPVVKVIRMDPSESFLIGENSVEKCGSLDWLRITTPDTIVDYEYDENLLAPDMSEVAKNFKSLNENQKERVISFCTREIIQKYTCLENLDTEYFKKERIWKLSLFDHNGMALDFFFSISKDGINISEKKQKFEWLTEIPIATLHEALENAASLNTLYIRINNCSFDPQTEKNLEEADPMQDPLLRCLYNGIFASYQKHQLKNIIY